MISLTCIYKFLANTKKIPIDLKTRRDSVSNGYWKISKNDPNKYIAILIQHTN